MKEQRKEFKYFTIMEYEKEQEYLREQHQQGWKLVKVTGLGMYHFEKCQPEDVVYQLDYNKEGREQKEEYVQMFADCGWEYITDFVGYSYFRKAVCEMAGNEEAIFCDDASRLEMMERVFKGRMVPVLSMLAILVFLLLSQGAEWPYGLVLTYLAPLLLWAVIFINYGVKYAGYKKKIGK